MDRDLLEEYEKNCITEGKFNEAELATQRIEELKEQEIYYNGIALVEKN